MIGIDKRWGQIEFWQVLKRESEIHTASYYLAAFDLEKNNSGRIVPKPETERIYIELFGRTLLLSLLITVTTLLLGYPVAFLLASLPTRISNLLMILVLLPFWTSLLVRTSAWIALLQKEGVINDFLVALHILDEANRLSMIYNATGTVIAMTHILLPFMVLPLFSVMKTISPDYTRAARSLGATPFTAFRRIYLPNTVPGIGAGGILVFILAIGYYITPALVGGTAGTFISNLIAYHISTSLNWGLAAALATILLLLILALYLLYDKVVGIANIKLD
jgi:putative spermidine/putrescine transport system permease protein